MVQATSIAQDAASYRHARMARRSMKLLEQIRGELEKLGPMLDMEMVREPEAVGNGWRPDPHELKHRAGMAFRTCDRGSAGGEGNGVSCLPAGAGKIPPSGTDWIHEIKHDGFRSSPCAVMAACGF
jgi:hypothetical protein